MGKKFVEELILPSGGMDTHAHLDLEDFSKDLKDVILRADSKGVSFITNVFLNIDAYKRKKYMFLPYKNIYFALGIHPHETENITEHHISLMESVFREDPKLRAVGEIGLDFYRNYSPKEKQIKAFKMQLALARELDVPVVIHCRDAEQDTLKILSEMKFKDYPLLWHCFTKGISLAEEILKNGWMLSIPGPVTFKKATHLQEAVFNIPIDKMVVETDCPFLTPHPFRGKRNEPGYVVYTAKKIAEIKGMDKEKTWEILSKNGRDFFGV